MSAGEKASQKVKLGIAGCGATRVMYGVILRHLDNGTLVAAMDPDESKAQEMRERFGARQVFTSYEEFLGKADIDAVILGSPVFLHAAQVAEAAAAGKHVLCEKPMARTVAECDAMIAACRNHRVKLMVAFMKRFDKSMRYAAELIQSGSLGEVVQVLSDWSCYSGRGGGGWRSSLPTWGGIFQDHGSHTIDLCRWWMGEVETVSGEISITLKGNEVEDQASAVMRHVGGGVSIHRQTRMTHKPLTEYYLIDGTRASLEIEFGPAWSFVSTDPFRMRLYERGNRVTDVTRHNSFDIDAETRATGRYKKELEHFCDCILTDAMPLVGGEEGRKAIEVINAVYLSSATGRKVHLPLTEQPDLERLFASMPKRGLEDDAACLG